MGPNMRHLPLQDACWRKGFKATGSTYTILRRAKSRSSGIQVLAEVVLREVFSGASLHVAGQPPRVQHLRLGCLRVCCYAHTILSRALQKDCHSSCYSSHMQFFGNLQDLWSPAEQHRARILPQMLQGLPSGYHSELE